MQIRTNSFSLVLPLLKDHAKRIRQSSFMSNFVSVGLASVLSNLIGLITLGYAARKLGPENYGLVIYGTSVAAYAGLLLVPGFTKWGIRAVAQRQNQRGKILLEINLTRIILAILAYSGLIIFSLKSSISIPERGIIIICGLTLFSNALSIDWLFYGMEAMQIPASLSVLASILNTIGLFVFIKSPVDVYRLPLIGVVTQLVCQGIQFLILFRNYKVAFVFPSLEDIKIAVISSIPLGLMSIIAIVYRNANNIIIKQSLGIAATGIFYAAFRLVDITNIFIHMINQVLFPRLSRLFIENKANATKETEIYIRILVTIGVGLGAFIFCEAKSLIMFIYGQFYESATIPLKILAFVTIFGVAGVSYASVLVPFRKDEIMLRITLIMGMVAVAGSFLLVPRYGLIGASATFVLVDVFALLLSMYSYYKIVGTLHLSTWILPTIGFLLVVFISYLLNGLGYIEWIRYFVEGIIYFFIGILNVRPLFNLITIDSRKEFITYYNNPGK